VIFLKGRISEHLEPFIEGVAILDKRGGSIPFNAILDTGFNDELVLPDYLFRRAHLVPSGVTQYQMADGSQVRDTVYRGALLIGARKIKVRLSLTAARVGLLGMRLLLRRVATFDLHKKIFWVEERNFRKK